MAVQYRALVKGNVIAGFHALCDPIVLKQEKGQLVQL